MSFRIVLYAPNAVAGNEVMEYAVGHHKCLVTEFVEAPLGEAAEKSGAEDKVVAKKRASLPPDTPYTLIIPEKGGPFKKNTIRAEALQRLRKYFGAGEHEVKRPDVRKILEQWYPQASAETVVVGLSQMKLLVPKEGS